MRKAESPQTHKRTVRRICLIAAGICVLACTITATATGFGIRMLRAFTSDTESGYDLTAQIQKIPETDLSKDVCDLGQVIVKQIETYAMHDNRMPETVEKTFRSQEDGIAFVGLASITPLRWNLPQQQTTLNVLGSNAGKIEMLTIQTNYTVGEIRMNAFCEIYTENFQGDITVETGSRWAEDVSFRQQTQKNLAGHPYLAVHALSMESGILSLDGYLTDDGLLYFLHIAYPEQDAQEAEAYLQQWADLFGE